MLGISRSRQQTYAPDTADAVVDTVTGEVVPLPVAGSVVGAFFDPDGNLLVRARHGSATTLSLFTPAGKLLVQAQCEAMYFRSF